MDTLFFYMAVVGGTFLAIQTLMLVLGIGVDADVDVDSDFDIDADHGDSTILKKLSLQAIVAFVTFFGLTGLAMRHAEIGIGAASAGAVAAGVGAIWVVGSLMASLAKLQSKGNLDLQNAVGQRARVYVKIPSADAGTGLVHVAVQGRRAECKARTAGPEIPSGAEVQVLSVAADGVLEVALQAS